MSPDSALKFSLTKLTPIGVLTATISRVAAALVSLKFDGLEVLEPGPDRARSAFLEGVVMAPWVNRLAESCFDGGCGLSVCNRQPALDSGWQF